MGAIQNLLEEIRRRYSGIVDAIIRRRLRFPNDISEQLIRAVLIIHPAMNVEHALLGTPVIRAVRGKLPGAHLAVLTDATAAPVLENNLHLDDLFVFHRKFSAWTISAASTFLSGLWCRYDLVIVLELPGTARLSKILALFTRARFVLGSGRAGGPSRLSDLCYNLVAPYAWYSLHQAERFLDVVRYIHVDTDALSEELFLTQKEKRNAVEYLRRHGCKVEDLIFVIDLQSDHDEYILPISLYVHLAKYFNAYHGAKVLISSDNSEDDLVAEFLEALSFSPHVVANLNTRSLAAVFHHCDLLLCSDSAIMHIVASVGTSLLGVFGKRNPKQWKPAGRQFVGMRVSREAVGQIKEQYLINRLEGLLTEFPKSRRLGAGHFDISEQVLRDCMQSIQKFYF